MTTKPHYDIVSVGSAVRDTTFYTNAAELIDNPQHDLTKSKLIGFEYGAKIRGDNIFQSIGGGAANTAVGMSKLGLQAGALICLGKDVDGQAVETRLKEMKVHTQLLQHDRKQSTGFSFLVVESKTNEHVAFAYYGANEFLRITPALLRSFTTDWFYISSLSMPDWFGAMQILVRTKCNVVWNPGATQLAGRTAQLRTLLKDIYVLILNKDEATELALKFKPKIKDVSVENLARILFTLGPNLVLITDGRNGSRVFDGTKVYFAKPSPDKPVDTTGAGDCFGASFTTGLIRFRGNIQQALQLGIVNSTSAVSEVGAQEGLLTWRQVSALLKKI